MCHSPYALLAKDADIARELSLFVLTPEAVAAAADVDAAFLAKAADGVDMDCVLEGDAANCREGLESELRLEKAKGIACVDDS